MVFSSKKPNLHSMDIQSGATEVLSQRTSQASVEGVHNTDCGSSYEVFTGTDMHISYKIVVDADKEEREKVKNIIKNTFQIVDDDLNNWNEYSLISKYNKTEIGSSIEISHSLRELLLLSDEVYKKTKGLFDPTKNGCWTSPKLTTNLDSIILTKVSDAEIDLCGISKGYAVDMVTAGLLQEGFTDCYIEWGGDIKTIGSWNVSIKDEKDGILGKIVATDMAVATSGRGRSTHKFNKINNRIQTASCLHSQCAIADAMATAMMFDDCSFCEDRLLYSIDSPDSNPSVKTSGLYQSQFGKNLTKHPHCRDLLKSIPHHLVRLRLKDEEPITVSSVVAIAGTTLVFLSLMRGSIISKNIIVGCELKMQQHTTPELITIRVVDIRHIGDHVAVWCTLPIDLKTDKFNTVSVRQRSLISPIPKVMGFFIDSMALLYCNNQFVKVSGVRLHSQAPYLVSVVCANGSIKKNDKITVYILDAAHYKYVKGDCDNIKKLKADDGIVIPLEHGHVKGVVTEVHRSVLFIEIASSCSLSRCSSSVLLYDSNYKQVSLPVPMLMHPLWICFKGIIVLSLAFALFTWWVVEPQMIDFTDSLAK